MDECIATEPECDEEELTTEELSASLCLQAKRLGELFQSCETSYQAFHVRIATDLDPIEEALLTPKEKMRVWLEKHQLPMRITFHDFFEAFLQDHKKEGRLDLSNRSVDLNQDACIVLGYKRSKKTMPLLDLIERLTTLFE